MVSTEFKQTLWKTADKLRAQMDAAEYKYIVLGLIFLKYISDTFVQQQEKVRQMVSDPSSEFFISEDPADYAEELEERDYYTQDNVFWVPQEARWETLRSKVKQPDIGSLVDSAMTAIENENPGNQFADIAVAIDDQDFERRIFAGFRLETFLSFLGDLYENKSLLNPVLRFA